MKKPFTGSLKFKLGLSFIIAAAIPFAAVLYLTEKLTTQSIELGFNEQISMSLDNLAKIYPELFRNRRALAEAQADILAMHPIMKMPMQNESDEEKIKELLKSLFEHNEHIRKAIVSNDQSRVEFRVPLKNDELESDIVIERLTPGGMRINLVFGLEKELIASREMAEELSDQYQTLYSESVSAGRAYRNAFLTLWTLCALFGGFLALLTARNITSRISSLSKATQKVSQGDLNARVEVGGDDEIAGLADAFNKMIEELSVRGEKIVYLEKISSWQEMARRLAHEIKNPLTPIQLAMQQLENRWKKTENNDPRFGRLLEESVEIVREEIETLGHLVGEFSAFAKLPDVSPEETDLVSWSREFIRTHPDLAEKAAISFNAPDNPIFTLLDRTMMRRVMTNLVSNAIDAVEKTGKIPNVMITVNSSEKDARLRIADNGPGMPPEVRERIFDPYFTTKSSGTGLGLTISKKIILQHGGSIAAAFPPDGGTIMEIRLPLYNPDAA